MKARFIIVAAAMAAALVAGAVHSESRMPNVAIRSDQLPGSGHSWGIGALDPTRPYLFLARRENGLSVFDVATHKLLKNVADTEGANAIAFAPQLDRAFIAYMDGSLGILKLSNIIQLKRIAVDDGNLNNLVFDAVSGKLVITGGRRVGRSAIWLFDPQTNSIVKKHEFDAHKFDGPLGLVDGTILIPLRDEGRVMRISAATLPPLPNWSGKQFPGCEQPSALAADEKLGRLFVACRGKTPQLIVARLNDGTPLMALPATPAINALAWDGARRLLLVPSGNAANLTLIGMDGDDQTERYRTLGYVGTRPWAHNMVYDSVRGTAYLFTMDFTQPAPNSAGHKQDPIFLAGSFTVLSITLNLPE